MTTTFSRRDVLAGAAALAAAPALAPATALARPTSYSMIGQHAPDWTLPRVGGGRMSLRQFRGRTLVMEFFALWCSDSVADGPNVAALYNAIREDRRLAFVSIHTRARLNAIEALARGRFGRFGSVENYFRQQGWSYPTVLDNDATAYHAYDLAWVPSFVVVDPAGVIRHYSTDLVAGDGPGVAGFLQEVRRVASVTAQAAPRHG